MANHVIVNFKPTKEKAEELVLIKILDSEDVILELPLAVHPFGANFEFPTIFGNVNGVPLIQDAQEVLEKTRMFHFKEGVFDEEKKYSPISEVDVKEASIHVRLPKDTKVEELISMNGQIVWAQRAAAK